MQSGDFERKTWHIQREDVSVWAFIWMSCCRLDIKALFTESVKVEAAQPAEDVSLFRRPPPN